MLQGKVPPADKIAIQYTCYSSALFRSYTPPRKPFLCSCDICLLVKFQKANLLKGDEDLFCTLALLENGDEQGSIR